MPKKLPYDFCMTLKMAADRLGYLTKHGPQKIRNLIAIGEIKATVKPRGESNTKNDWCVSFRSIEKWRIDHE